jgi:hypothetical protein
VNARSIRRAAERAAHKQTEKETKNIPVSEAQLAANRANAQLYSGPRSGIGKRVSSLNAVKTGLTAPAKVAKPQVLPNNGFELIKRLEESGKRISNSRWRNGKGNRQPGRARIPAAGQQ